jgi:pyruvate dehydrogenase E2 component (dihydrolipoamide acetyltransferase)
MTGEAASITCAAAPGAPHAVLLHGFGGEAAQWLPVMERLLAAGVATTAFDMPGHGGSLGMGAKGARDAALAILAALPDGVKVHLAGHSFGGAVAALCTLMQPERFSALTLLSPGGFGPEINAAALDGLVAADGIDALRLAYQPFHAQGFIMPQRVLEAACAARQRPGGRDALAALARLILKEDGTQGVLPLARLAASAVPLTLVWGIEDAILPVAQARAFPAPRHVLLDGIGHMLHDEAPLAVAETLLRPVPA